MPKVFIRISERVTYSREVEMTQAEWDELDVKTDRRGRLFNKVVKELRETYIRPAHDWEYTDRLRLDHLSLLLED